MQTQLCCRPANFFPSLLSPLPPSLPPPSALPSPRRQAGGSHCSNRLWEIPPSWPHSRGQRNPGVPALCAELRGVHGQSQKLWMGRGGWAGLRRWTLPSREVGHHDPAARHPIPSRSGVSLDSTGPGVPRGILGLPHPGPGLATRCHLRDVPGAQYHWPGPVDGDTEALGGTESLSVAHPALCGQGQA